MLPNPKPSLFSRLAPEIPDPLSFTLRMRLGGSQRSVTLTTVGLAWRTTLLIASWAKRSSSCCILGGNLSSGMLSDRKSQRKLVGLFPAAVADFFTSSFAGPIAIEYPLAISGENRMAISTGAARTRQHPRTGGGVGMAKVRSFVDVSNSGGCQKSDVLRHDKRLTFHCS